MEYLILITVVIGGYFLWKEIKKTKNDNDVLNTNFTESLTTSVNSSLQQGITGIATLRGSIDELLIQRNNENRTILQDMASNVLNVHEMLNNPTSAGQFGNWQLAIGNCQLPVANCKLPIANCQLPVANLQLANDNWQMAIGHWQLATGSGKLAISNGQFTMGNWQSAVGSWQLAMAIGNWRLAIGTIVPIGDWRPTGDWRLAIGDW